MTLFLNFMKKTTFITVLLCLVAMVGKADSTWKNSYALGQTEEWYASQEAVRVAENVLIYQRHSGGWPKNIEMHEELSEEQKAEIVEQKYDLSCFDNGATTTEMRFLAKVYKHTPDERYLEAFKRGLDCIIEAQSLCGSGWPQYWPKREGGVGSLYSNFITFNDDVMVKILKMLRDVVKNDGDFAQITDEVTRQKAQTCFDKGVQCILDCQIRTDDGELTVWCAQHDPTTLLPAVGRNYEMPSYSGSESVGVLNFLMSLPNPSDEVKQAIEGGVRWFEENALENKALEKFANEAGERDVRMVDAEGSRLWGRFVQIGGEIGRRTYEALFDYLEKYGSTRSVMVDGRYVEYRDVDNARNTYDPSMADRPICCHKSQDNGCAYRFTYNFHDTPPVADENGVMMPTSLDTYDRTSYTFISNWGEGLAERYEEWKRSIDDAKQGGVKYAIAKDETFASGTTKEFDGISLTFGEIGGADFLAPVMAVYDDTFCYYTPGNNVNGNKAGGTFYLFNPAKNGRLTVCIRHNVVKPLYVEKNSVALPDYDGVTFDTSHPSSYTISIPIEAGSTYKLYCSGSKLGFYGFVFTPDDNDDPQGIRPQMADEHRGNGRIYTLSGVQLPFLGKGINIVDGKMVYVK